MSNNNLYTLGIDIGSTTVKIAILNEQNEVLFSDYERHFANIQETLSDLLGRAIYKLGAIHVIAGHYRFRRTDTCKTLRDTICSGSHCSIYCTSRLCSTDRRRNRTWWRRCKNHLFRRR